MSRYNKQKLCLVVSFLILSLLITIAIYVPMQFVKAAHSPKQVVLKELGSKYITGKVINNYYFGGDDIEDNMAKWHINPNKAIFGEKQYYIKVLTDDTTFNHLNEFVQPGDVLDAKLSQKHNNNELKVENTAVFYGKDTSSNIIRTLYLLRFSTNRALEDKEEVKIKVKRPMVVVPDKFLKNDEVRVKSGKQWIIKYVKVSYHIKNKNYISTNYLKNGDIIKKY
ncbi:hypothetical protein [Leuconostoc miyukkimchii]|uniref:hypothetical protein n=1 Tax=Leuconostoc miyukkimchii TaxID=910540 RepID=UPI001C7D3B9E|nr:hypothetical protein [Leuconostoc miyukkimchii]